MNNTDYLRTRHDKVKIDFNSAKEILFTLIEGKRERLKYLVDKNSTSDWVIEKENSELEQLNLIFTFFAELKYGNVYFDCCKIYSEIEKQDDQVNGVFIRLQFRKGERENIAYISNMKTYEQ